jgi:nucleotide-binding universal stress UspA family protein
MMPHSTPAGAPARDHASPLVAAVFGSIVCGFDDSRPALIACEQATVLARGAPLHLVAVCHEQGFGPTHQTILGRARAADALEVARRAAADRGITTSTEIVEGEPPGPCLAAAVPDADALLVVGTHGNRRAGGIMLGSTATWLAHAYPGALLIARRPPRDGAAFPNRIVIAHDGRDAEPAELGARLAAAYDATVHVVHAGPSDAAARRALALAAVSIGEATGREPTVESVEGRPHHAIAAVARRDGASLLVCGRRGRRGIAALGSVSERLVHDAPCSVLVTAPPAADAE